MSEEKSTPHVLEFTQNGLEIDLETARFVFKGMVVEGIVLAKLLNMIPSPPHDHKAVHYGSPDMKLKMICGGYGSEPYTSDKKLVTCKGCRKIFRLD